VYNDQILLNYKSTLEGSIKEVLFLSCPLDHEEKNERGRDERSKAK
jgi:hypothetical protein